MKVHLTAGGCLSIFILCLLVFGRSPLMAAEVPPAVEKAATEGLPVFLEALPEDILSQFNFSGPEELDRATLGTPFQVYSIDPQDILDYDAGTPIDSIVYGTDQWLFPVTIDGQVRVLLEVANMKGTYQAVALGSAGLGQQWSNANEQYSSRDGYINTLVRIYQAKADFVLLGGAGGDKLLPLEAGRIALGGTGEVEPMNPADVISGLQETVKRNIETFK
jgi:hypothetical protein